jgi:hypothetical protein
VNGFGIACLSLSLVLGADGENASPDNLRSVIAGLKAETLGDKELQKLVQAGTKSVQSVPGSFLTDELEFLRLAAAKCGKDAKRREMLQALLDLLQTKYRNEPCSLVQVLIEEAGIYRDDLAERDKERALLVRAERLQERLQISQAKQQVEVSLRLGESFLSTDRKRSLDYFNKVLAFPLFEEPYAKEDAFKTLYTEAALRVVGLTEPKDLPALRLHPFVLERVQRTFGDKALRLSGELPDVAVFRAKLTLWLELSLKDQPAASPLRPHLAAVLTYVKNMPR